jgi:cation diffusion facilitator CzcD-associated flavoprotein CzcO
MDNKIDFEVVIIGSGFAGIGMAINLLKNNIKDFIILEREPVLGGTWWRNSYPGAAVDVPSHLYSFSFESFDWTRLYANQPELLTYTNHVLDKYKLREKALSNSKVEKLEYDEKNAIWNIQIVGGKHLKANNIINASGGLSQPAFPNLKGIETFKGKTMHTGLWDHDYDYSDKKIAIIGTGASAVQVVPELAEKAKKLYVLQRSAHWILHRPDRHLKSFERKLLKNKLIEKVFRNFTYWKFEMRILAFQVYPNLMKLFQKKAFSHLKSQVKDKELVKKLTPNYIIGCKRILISNNYYPTLQKSNVELITDDISSINENGIELKNGNQLDVDFIVFATGFHAAENTIPYPVLGKNGVGITEKWKNGAYAYIGTVVEDFPNFYIIMGPNTAIGHTSAIFMMECQMEYITKAISNKIQNAWKSIEIKKDVVEEYNKKIQKQLEGTIWNKGGCKSWYQTKDGKITTLYPTFSFIFKKQTSEFKKEEHLIN